MQPGLTKVGVTEGNPRGDRRKSPWETGGTALHHPVGGWGAPLDIDLAADGLTALLLILTQFVALPLFVYARSYFAAAAASWFWPLAGFLLAGMNARFLSADQFNLYVTLELVGLAAVGLVAVRSSSRRRCSPRWW
jgi:formate hydrogenlyase subunit 3/multisubunit Na+/H+ antiporter MnhD subunit